jgi:hypothetical protein
MEREKLVDVDVLELARIKRAPTIVPQAPQFCGSVAIFAQDLPQSDSVDMVLYGPHL